MTDHAAPVGAQSAQGKAGGRGHDWLLVIMGLALIAAPFFYGYTKLAVGYTAWIAGAAILALSAFNWRADRTAIWIAQALIGVAVFASPFLTHATARAMATEAHVMIGLAIFFAVAMKVWGRYRGDAPEMPAQDRLR